MGLRLFGTDGIRGRFGVYPLDAQTVRQLGLALARLLRESGDSSPAASAPRVVVGGDTRQSTPTLCRWLAQGLQRGGASLSYLGVLPTPGVVHFVRRQQAACGIAVSASHNPPGDNGIKLISRQGFKWTPQQEEELEGRLHAGAAGEWGSQDPVPMPAQGVGDYLDALAGTLSAERPLAGLRLTLDPAHGAASPYASSLYTSLGARVEAIHQTADGRRINRDCGSTHPGELARLTASTRSHLGLAFDGDADRVILVDEGGEVRDGDAILYLWARKLLESGELDPPRIVATTMSNLGLERSLARAGVEVVRCEVGDRAVVETLRRQGILLGGEQSGHVIHLGLSTTGDGLLTGLHMAALVKENGSLVRLLEGLVRYPQVLLNVRVTEKPPFDELPELAAAIRKAKETLGEGGRLVLRYSGTEPVARIMIEGEQRQLIEPLAAEIASRLQQCVGAATPDE